MRDSETVVYAPHSHPDIHDDRVIVQINEEGCRLLLFFKDLSGDGPLLEMRLLPLAAGKRFEPWRLVPRLSLYMQYARAVVAWRREDARAALRALRKAGSMDRGLSHDFYAGIAAEYESLVTEGERYPIKALAATYGVDKSTASRWVRGARDRNLIPEEVSA
jgi:hypothetical protein